MQRTILLLVLVATALGATLAATRKEADWKKVEQAMSKGLPQTAIRALEPIIQRALQEKEYGEAAKAITTKVALEGNIEGNRPEVRITRLQATMKDLPPDMQPIMQAVLAHWYWHYFQQNRWRFMQRTQTAEPSGDDIQTWDLARILQETDKHFSLALQAEKWLKATKVAQFDDLLEKGTMPDKMRPTMYDFMAHEALVFYSAGEQAGATAEDSFVLAADSPIFAPVAQFISWQPQTTDLHSPTLKAIRLLQSLLVFHRDDADPSAFADANLERLRFGTNHAFGEEKDTRYKEALARFTKHWAEYPVAARAMHAGAEILQRENELVAAHKLAEQGWQAYPDSPGGKLCYNLIQQLQSKSIQVATERVWNSPWPAIQVRYRNVTRVYFRAVRYNWLSLFKRPDYRSGGGVPVGLRAELLQREPDYVWQHTLAATDDFQFRSVALNVPWELKPGFYFLIASVDERFSDRDNQVVASEFWVSKLALVLRSGTDAGACDGFILDAEDGEPQSDVPVRAWYQSRAGWVETRPARTDRNGQFRFSALPSSNYVVLAQQNNSMLASATRSAYGRSYQPKPYQRTIFFTDRSIYRPGQTIRYKGISISIDQNSDTYKTLSGEMVTVVFQDVNGKEIATQRHRTNEFGSFSGSFTAPRDRLLGRMSLLDKARGNSRTYFYVEEYKRPKFQVELAAPTEPARLDQPVVVPGSARAYTGAPIGDAKVTYRVVRQVRYPAWCVFWWPMPTGESQEIAHGTTSTNANGAFEVSFTARPDPTADKKNEPIFQYTVYADVTDSAGETRSDQHDINVGYTALQASMTATDWQTTDQPVTVNINTRSLDGQPRAAKGIVHIYKLQEPNSVHRAEIAAPGIPRYWPGMERSTTPPAPDLSNPDMWELGVQVAERPFGTDASGTTTISLPLDAGVYRAVLETHDPFGKRITARLPIMVLDPTSDRLSIKIPNVVKAPAWQLEPGATLLALWGTGYESGRAFVEIEHRGKILQSYWTAPRATQAIIEQNVTESMRGGFTLRVTQVRDNRAYLVTRQVAVPWTNKKLAIRWEHFVSKLKPGEQQRWTAIIQGPKAGPAAAELVATLYDASLDAFHPHSWRNLQVFRQDYSRLRSQFENFGVGLNPIQGNWVQDYKDVTISYRHFPTEITTSLWGYGWFGDRVQRRFRGGRGGMPAPGAAMAGGVPSNDMMSLDAASAPMAAKAMPAYSAEAMPREKAAGAGPAAPPKIDLSKVAARTNLNETAFFFPQLVTDESGKVTLTFTMPEALTEWKFIGFAHDSQLRSGMLADHVVTAKDLMVQPLPPRFVREGDELEFTVKVTNQSPTRQTGTVRLTLADAATLKSVDPLLGNSQLDRPFDVPAGQSRSYAWRLQIPDGMGFLTYKAVGSTGRLADGEEGYLPVLSRRILVTESLPLPIRGATTKKFTFAKLIDSGKSDTLRNESLTVQMVSNPAWYAVMALPYLMEYPYECTEQTFNRLYANILAQHIAASDPKIRRIFDQWKGTPALDSPMEKNQDLKAVLLEETPWVRQAQTESQARRDVGILFDANRLNDETARVLRKLTDLQLSDGAWPWFPTGRANDYITLYITTGFGRLRHLGADIDVSVAVKALARLDDWIDRRYHDILEHSDPKQNHLSPTIALYLYGRSFFLDDQKIAPNHKAAVDYFLDQARRYWLQLSNRQSQAHIALALKRFGDIQTPQAIMRSIKERSVTDDELGMLWRDTELSWWWYRAPIETQAMMIEAFDEIMNDTKAVELCRVWLLKQKQTQDWKTTKATADAVYSLLLRGTDLLASDALVQVTLGGQLIQPQHVEAGTGFYEQRFVRDEIKPAMGHIQVTKADAGVAWGSVHWQYLEDMSKVTPYAGTPLTLVKHLYVKKNSKKGPVLQPVNETLAVGDELVVRLELRVDRDMEYVHLKDQRGSGLEPVDVLSRYRYQDGLAYYESTRDTASHFFIDYLPKGTYVFEYSTRVVHRGKYQSGMAQIQCMYAPEFNSHSDSSVLTVQ